MNKKIIESVSGIIHKELFILIAEILLPALLINFGISGIRNVNYLKDFGVQAVGQVYGMGGNGWITEYAEFTDGSGVSHSIITDLLFTPSKKNYTVLYDPSNPSNAIVEGSETRAYPAIALIFGILLLPISLYRIWKLFSDKLRRKRGS